MRSRNHDDIEYKRRATRLREALRRRGVKKIYALALDLDVDQSTISRWTKDGGMSLDHAAALCSRLNISLDWLISGQGGMEAQSRNRDVAAIADLLETLEPELVASFMTIVQALAERR